jgi:hypothetical protein
MHILLFEVHVLYLPRSHGHPWIRLHLELSPYLKIFLTYSEQLHPVNSWQPLRYIGLIFISTRPVETVSDRLQADISCKYCAALVNIQRDNLQFIKRTCYRFTNNNSEKQTTRYATLATYICQQHNNIQYRTTTKSLLTVYEIRGKIYLWPCVM